MPPLQRRQANPHPAAVKKPWYKRPYFVTAILVPVLITAIGGWLLKGGEKVGSEIRDFVAGPKTIEFQTENGPLVSVQVRQGMDCFGHGYVYPSDSGITTFTKPNEGPKANGKAWYEDPEAFGAVPASPVLLFIGATGPSDHAITLTGLTFNVIERKAPLDGDQIRVLTGCGGQGSFRYGSVDFDTKPPYYVDDPTPPTTISITPLRFPYTISASDLENIIIKITTVECRCSWTADLQWTDGKNRHHAD
jgi:hypothetical protein